jgi:hypothetical protein
MFSQYTKGRSNPEAHTVCTESIFLFLLFFFANEYARCLLAGDSLLRVQSRGDLHSICSGESRMKGTVHYTTPVKQWVRR